jgi:hypothetical protein
MVLCRCRYNLPTDANLTRCKQANFNSLPLVTYQVFQSIQFLSARVSHFVLLTLFCFFLLLFFYWWRCLKVLFRLPLTLWFPLAKSYKCFLIICFPRVYFLFVLITQIMSSQACCMGSWIREVTTELLAFPNPSLVIALSTLLNRVTLIFLLYTLHVFVFTDLMLFLYVSFQTLLNWFCSVVIGSTCPL